MPDQGREEPQGHQGRHHQMVQEQIRGYCAISLAWSATWTSFKRCIKAERRDGNDHTASNLCLVEDFANKLLSIADILLLHDILAEMTRRPNARSSMKTRIQDTEDPLYPHLMFFEVNLSRTDG